MRCAEYLLILQSLICSVARRLAITPVPSNIEHPVNALTLPGLSLVELIAAVWFWVLMLCHEALASPLSRFFLRRGLVLWRLRGIAAAARN